MLIGVWQEYALARQLQARRAGDHNVQLVLQWEDDYPEEVDTIPRRRRHAPPPKPQEGPKLSPPPRPAQPWIKAFGAGRKQCPKRQPQQQPTAAKSAANRPRRLRDVNRMRRAYLSGGQSPVEYQEETEGAHVEPANGPSIITVDDVPSQTGSPDAVWSQDGGGSANEEEEVDELMRWVKGLDNE